MNCYALGDGKTLYDGQNFKIESISSLKSKGANGVVSIIQITPKSKSAILFYDQDNNIIPQISWSNPQNIKDIISDAKFNAKDNSLIFILNLNLKDTSKIGTAKFTMQFSLCGENCYPEIIKSKLRISNLYDKRKLDFIHKVASEAESKPNIVWYIILSLLGGLLLNLMPCVLPVLSLKVFSILNNAGKKQLEIKKNLIATACGIIFTFILLGIFISVLKFLGNYAGLGIHFQNPFFVIFVVILLVILATQISTGIRIRLPNFILLSLTSKSGDDKIVGSFFNGVLATIIATPCTAPFVSSVTTFAISSGIYEIMIIFLSMGAGMALPFIFLSLSLKARLLIPNPGSWMVNFKRLMEIFLYLTIIWLLYVLANLLDYNSVAILFLLCLLLKFSLSNNSSLLSKRYIRIVISSLILGLCFYVPIQNKKNDDVRAEEIDEIWQKFSYAKLEKSLSENRIVFVDITADWCVTCKYNKFVVLNNEYVMSIIKKYNVVALRGDYTRENQDINKFLSSHNRYAIPLDVIYSKKTPQGFALPPILTTGEVVKAIIQAK